MSVGSSPPGPNTMLSNLPSLVFRQMYQTDIENHSSILMWHLSHIQHRADIYIEVASSCVFPTYPRRL